MLKLNFNLRHQAITLLNPGTIVATDSKNYLVANFNFISDDWEYPLTAVFTSDVEKIPYTILVGQSEELEENECFIPWEVLQSSGNVYVSVFCGDLHTTNTVKFKVVKSGYTEGEIPPPPTPTIYEQILQALDSKQPMLTAGENITITEENVISASSGSNDYTALENKPSINNITLSGNKSSDDLSLQGKLTAGNNITISDDNVISAEGGTDDYEDLSNKPKYNINYDGTFANRDIIGIIKFLPPFFQDENGITLKNITNQSLQNYTQYFYGFYSRAVTYNFGATLSHVFVRCGCFSTTVNFCSNIPSAFSPYLPSNDLFYIIHLFTTHGAYNSQLARMVIFEDNTSHKIRVFSQFIECERSNPEATITAITDWEELGGSIQIVSAAVNNNGTITFTDSNGNTFTTTGSNVIGADGFSPVATVTQTASGATISITDSTGTTTANISNGQDGNDYILTAQDKSDIADIVLGELPNADTMSF